MSGEDEMPSERPQTHDNYHSLLNRGANTDMGLLADEVAWTGTKRGKGKFVIIGLVAVAAIIAGALL
jgi:hypothetical protein